MKGHTDLVQSIAYNPDEKTLASARNEGSIRLWGLNAGKEQTALTDPANNGPISSIKFSPDGKRLAAAYQNGLFAIWDTASAKEISETNVQPGIEPKGGFEFGFSQEEHFIVTANRADDTLNRWTVK